MFDLSHVNLWAVLLVTVLDMAIGYLWYSKFAFGEIWAKLNDQNLSNMNVNPAIYLVNFVVFFVMSFALAQAIFFTVATDLWAGVMVGFAVWIGFVATATIIENLFARRSWKLYMINYGYNLVNLLVSGAILAIWL